MNPTDANIATCNLHLRGEIASIDAYTHALEVFEDTPCARVMSHIRTAHHRNADSLRKWVLTAGSRPTHRVGVWGLLVRRAESSITWLGETSTLMMLQRAEEHGWRAYQRSLHAESLSPGTKALIQDDIIPLITANIVALHQHRHRTLARAERPQRWRSPANDDSDSE